MLNPKKSMFSEMVKIPYTEIENASRLVFNMKFPESENEENEHGDPATQVVFGDIFKNGKKNSKKTISDATKKENKILAATLRNFGIKEWSEKKSRQT